MDCSQLLQAYDKLVEDYNNAWASCYDPSVFDRLVGLGRTAEFGIAVLGAVVSLPTVVSSQYVALPEDQLTAARRALLYLQDAHDALDEIRNCARGVIEIGLHRDRVFGAYIDCEAERLSAQSLCSSEMDTVALLDPPDDSSEAEDVLSEVEGALADIQDEIETAEEIIEMMEDFIEEAEEIEDDISWV